MDIPNIPNASIPEPTPLAASDNRIDSCSRLLPNVEPSPPERFKANSKASISSTDTPICLESLPCLSVTEVVIAANPTRAAVPPITTLAKDLTVLTAESISLLNCSRSSGS